MGLFSSNQTKKCYFLANKGNYDWKQIANKINYIIGILQTVQKNKDDTKQMVQQKSLYFFMNDYKLNTQDELSFDIKQFNQINCPSSLLHFLLKKINKKYQNSQKINKPQYSGNSKYQDVLTIQRSISQTLDLKLKSLIGIFWPFQSALRNMNEQLEFLQKESQKSVKINKNNGINNLRYLLLRQIIKTIQLQQYLLKKQEQKINIKQIQNKLTTNCKSQTLNKRTISQSQPKHKAGKQGIKIIQTQHKKQQIESLIQFLKSFKSHVNNLISTQKTDDKQKQVSQKTYKNLHHIQKMNNSNLKINFLNNNQQAFGQKTSNNLTQSSFFNDDNQKNQNFINKTESCNEQIKINFSQYQQQIKNLNLQIERKNQDQKVYKQQIQNKKRTIEEQTHNINQLKRFNQSQNIRFEKIINSKVKLIEDKQYEIKKLNDKNKLIEVEIQQNNKEKSNKIYQLEQKVKYLVSQNYNLKRKHENQIYQLKQKINNIQVQSIDKSTEIDTLNKTIKLLRSDKQQLQTNYQSIFNQLNNKSLKISQMDKDINSYKIKTAQYQNQVDKLKQQFKKMQLNIQQSEQKCSQLQKKNQFIQKSCNQKSAYINLLQDKLKQQKQTHDKQIKQLNYQLQQNQKQLSQINNQNKQLQKQNQLYSNKIKSIRISKYFDGQILSLNTFQDTQWLVTNLQNHTKRHIRNTRLLYRFDINNPTNFHYYFDNKPNILFICKLKNDQIIAAYSQPPFIPKTNVDNRMGLMFGFKSRKIFTLKTQPTNKQNPTIPRPITYDQNYINWGNSDLSIKFGSKELYSSYSNTSCSYQIKGCPSTIADLLQQRERNIYMFNYELYEVKFQQQEK